MAVLLLWMACMTLLAGCATTSSPPRKPIDQLYAEAHKRHFAGIDPWLQATFRHGDAVMASSALIKTDLALVQPCLDGLPADDMSFLPKDCKHDETLAQYMDRKTDECEEIVCKFQGYQARHLGDIQRIEDQCKHDLEIVRLRKAVEKLSDTKK
jgi:hypothetical protein